MQSSRTDRGYPAEKARQGEIILRHTWSRVIFIGGLIAGLVLAFLMGALRY